MSTYPEHQRLRQEIRRSVAPLTGVYRLIDPYDQALYIGKSVNLRARLLSHFRGGSGTLAYGVRTFETRETQTELMALLLEDTLIKRELPRHNTRQAELVDFRYLILTNDPYPTCLAVEEARPDSSEVFGPVRGKYFAAEIIEVVNRTLGLRACADRHPFRRSANYDLGFCSGPCRGAIPEVAYQEIVGRVIAFLRGDDTEVALRLQLAIASQAEALAFERCAELERVLGRCRRFCVRQRFIEKFRDGALLLFDDGEGFCYEFAAGRLVGVQHVAKGASSPTSFPQELSEPMADPRALLDRAAIVHGWIEQHPETCRVETRGLETPARYGHDCS